MTTRVYCVLAALFAANVNGAFVLNGSPRFTNGSTALGMTKLNFGGKIVDAKPGTPIKNACAKAGFKPKYSCKKGDCGSCTISVGGSRMKACVGKVPPEPRLKSLQEKGLAVK
eukprot:CAMPEP_0196817866 /NCGR_PEP_ID=MMETSP1362-20130617/62923_1 /TAXON_ID=163516 /ORGANISM="Leptocylindrus danicus, Strain CCMP1856" /LENGTH=112 /DNA_ID=CAMNT_0042195735 /DNA_START=135 /DNA_END=473 /DNA_ORIENTATION=-